MIDSETTETHWASKEPEKLTLKDVYVPKMIEARRESWRGWLALLFSVLFAGEVIAVFILIGTKSIAIQDIGSLISMIVTPTVGLVGSVIGYYFGTKA